MSVNKNGDVFPIIEKVIEPGYVFRPYRPYIPLQVTPTFIEQENFLFDMKDYLLIEDTWEYSQ